MAWKTALVLAAIALLAKTASGAERVRRMYAMCPPSFERIGNQCYHLSARSDTWLDAFFNCKDLHSKLAEPEKLEDKRLRRYLEKYGNIVDDIWIGGVFNWKLNKWQWGYDGRALTYQSFSQMQPGSSRDLRFNCAVLNPVLRFRWSARVCTEEHRYLCQHRMPYVSERNRFRVYNKWNVTYPNEMANEIEIVVRSTGDRRRTHHRRPYHRRPNLVRPNSNHRFHSVPTQSLNKLGERRTNSHVPVHRLNQQIQSNRIIDNEPQYRPTEPTILPTSTPKKRQRQQQRRRKQKLTTPRPTPEKLGNDVRYQDEWGNSSEERFKADQEYRRGLLEYKKKYDAYNKETEDRRINESKKLIENGTLGSTEDYRRFPIPEPTKEAIAADYDPYRQQLERQKYEHQQEMARRRDEIERKQMEDDRKAREEEIKRQEMDRKQREERRRIQEEERLKESQDRQDKIRKQEEERDDERQRQEAERQQQEAERQQLQRQQQEKHNEERKHREKELERRRLEEEKNKLLDTQVEPSDQTPVMEKPSTRSPEDEKRHQQIEKIKAQNDVIRKQQEEARRREQEILRQANDERVEEERRREEELEDALRKEKDNEKKMELENEKLREEEEAKRREIERINAENEELKRQQKEEKLKREEEKRLKADEDARQVEKYNRELEKRRREEMRRREEQQQQEADDAKRKAEEEANASQPSSNENAIDSNGLNGNNGNSAKKPQSLDERKRKLQALKERLAKMTPEQREEYYAIKRKQKQKRNPDSIP